MLSVSDFLESSPPFAQLARAGYLYAAAKTLALDGVTPGQFVLFNGGSKGLPLWVLSVKVTTTAALKIDLLSLAVDPAIGGANVVNNMRIGAAAAQANTEAALVAQPAGSGIFVSKQVGTQDDYEFLFPASMFIPPGRGILIACANVLSTVSVSFLWAEIENLS